MKKTIFQYQQIGISVLKLRKKRPPEQTREEMIAESERNIFKEKLLKSFINALDKYSSKDAEQAKEDYLKILTDHPQYKAKICRGKFVNSYYVRILEEY